MTLSIVDFTERKSFILMPCLDSQVLFKESLPTPKSQTVPSFFH